MHTPPAVCATGSQYTLVQKNAYPAGARRTVRDVTSKEELQTWVQMLV